MKPHSIFLAVGIGSLVAFYNLNPMNLYTAPGGDFVGQSVTMVRDIVSGTDYYQHVVYPLTAFPLGVPFASLPDGLAGALFVGISSGLLAYAIVKRGQAWRLILFLSYPFVESVKTTQYSILFCLMMLAPQWLAWPFALIKPQLGLTGVMMRRPKRTSILIAASLLLASLIIDPLWPTKWLLQLIFYSNSIIQITPALVLPFGPLLLLSALKIRRVKWRALLSMALLPHRGFYDHLTLWMLVDDWRQMVLLTALSWVAWLIHRRIIDFSIVVIFYLFVFLAWNRYMLSNWLRPHTRLDAATDPKSHKVPTG